MAKEELPTCLTCGTQLQYNISNRIHTKKKNETNYRQHEILRLEKNIKIEEKTK